MSPYSWLEALVLGAVVGASAWTVFGQLLPGLKTRLLAALGRSEQRIAPACNSGCSRCDGCAAPRTAMPGATTESPIRFDRLGAQDRTSRDARVR